MEKPSDDIVHVFVLRDDFHLQVRLPEDLTPREAERLAMWVQTLPLPYVYELRGPSFTQVRRFDHWKEAFDSAHKDFPTCASLGDEHDSSVTLIVTGDDADNVVAKIHRVRR